MAYQQLLALSPYKITAVYLVFGIAWIATTDRLVVTIFQEPGMITLLQTAKGWLFVGLSALLIFGLTVIRRRQIDRTTETLRQATEQLQVLNRVLRHNVRNDMNVVTGYIGNALPDVDEQRTRDQLETALATAENLASIGEKLRVVNDLDVSPKPGDAHVDLVDLVESELGEIESAHPGVDVAFDAPERAHVRGEPPLRHAVREVLENAVVHNDRPANECEIGVEIGREGGRVRLAIADNGPSIGREELAAIEAGEETALVHMSGVGLWLTLWLTEYYGGELDVEVDPGEGTTVAFLFEPYADVLSRDGVSQTVSELAPATA